jgi:threonine aldolase
VCFSKGLGAPVGSALAGPKDLIKEARRHRKLFGGAMRQAGVIAAGALYAVEHHRQRLSEDHANAQLVAEAVRESAGLSLSPDTVDTNIVIFRVDPKLGTAAQFCDRLEQRGVLMSPNAKHKVRAVTHLDVSAQDAKRAAECLLEIGSKPS